MADHHKQHPRNTYNAKQGEPLTPAEQRIAEYIVAGTHTREEISDELFLSDNTIKTHLRHIRQKLGIRTVHAQCSYLWQIKYYLDVSELQRQLAELQNWEVRDAVD